MSCRQVAGKGQVVKRNILEMWTDEIWLRSNSDRPGERRAYQGANHMQSEQQRIIIYRAVCVFDDKKYWRIVALHLAI